MTGPVDIGLIFEQGDAITSALAKAALAAQREARVLGRPLIVWQDGGLSTCYPTSSRMSRPRNAAHNAWISVFDHEPTHACTTDLQAQAARLKFSLARG